MGSDLKFFAGILSGRCPQHQVEDVVGVDRQPADFRRCELQRPGNVASLAAVPVETERAEIRRRQFNRIPFQNDRSLGCIATAKDGRGRRMLAVGS